MIRSAWNKLDAPFWRAFCSFFLPNATPEQLRLFSDLHSKALSLQSGIMARMAVDAINVRPLLNQVRVPTMVSHSINDQLVPFEQGRLLARTIPNAAFVPLESGSTCRSSKGMQARFGAASWCHSCRGNRAGEQRISGIADGL